MMTRKLALLAALLLAAMPARGENVLDTDCSVLPASAVRAVPAPFDTYMDLVCTHAGQALRPKPGFQFLFREGPMYLTALNPATPQRMGPSEHFTALRVDPLSEAEAAALRADLHTIMSNPVIDASTIIRMREETSTGAIKQIYLLIPTGPGPVVGMECVHDCRPIRDDPWFFTIQPLEQNRDRPRKGM